MNQKENEMKQRELLREFDKQLFPYTGQIAWFLPGIFSFLSLGLMTVPVQEILDGSSYIGINIFIFIIWIPYFVLLPYINMTDAFRPHQKQNKTYDKLKYLPVSKKQYRIVRMEYLFRYVWKLTVIGLAVQCIFAIAILKYFDIWNVLYIAAILFALPLLAGWLLLL